MEQINKALDKLNDRESVVEGWSTPIFKEVPSFKLLDDFVPLDDNTRNSQAT